jgi:hypothetical protein
LRKGLKIERDILENECDFYEPTNPHLNPQWAPATASCKDFISLINGLEFSYRGDNICMISHKALFFNSK